MMEKRHEELPAYTDPSIKATLLASGATGTIYALVMPESEQGIRNVVDGLDDVDGHFDRTRNWLSMFREPWTQKQDAMHVAYFDEWLRWSSPVVRLDASSFAHRYPTAGASEGIFKIMSEYAATMRSQDRIPTIHVFHGEYEGFSSFAKSLHMDVIRHDRDDWRAVAEAPERDGQFWVSQPSSIDGGLWASFGDFASMMSELRPDMQIVPDLSYVGAVARDYEIGLDHPNIKSFVISQSKPFGGYYHRCGGVFSRTELPSLFANMWFKNLTSIAWGTRMMRTYGVHELPLRYRAQQEEAAALVARRLGIENLTCADISMLATAPAPAEPNPVIASLIRGKGSDRCIRVCLTPTMTVLMAPDMAPRMALALAGMDA